WRPDLGLSLEGRRSRIRKPEGFFCRPGDLRMTTPGDGRGQAPSQRGGRLMGAEERWAHTEKAIGEGIRAAWVAAERARDDAGGSFAAEAHARVAARGGSPLRGRTGNEVAGALQLATRAAP